MGGSEIIISESEEEAGFADAGVANQDQLY